MALALGLAACDGASPERDARLVEDPSRRICDGSSSLRFAFQGLGGFLPSGGAYLPLENGVHFLFVDGTCHYWAQRRQNEELRTGELTDEDEEALIAASRFRAWRGLAGAWTGENIPFDGGLTRLWDASFALNCQACQGDGSPPGVQEALAGAYTQLGELWAAGAPIQEGPLRLLLLDDGEGYMNALAWPLTPPPEAYVHTPASENHGVSTLISDPDDVRKLRALQSEHRARSPSGPEVIPVMGDAGKVYTLGLREALPFEDARGLIDPSRRPRRLTATGPQARRGPGL